MADRLVARFRASAHDILRTGTQRPRRRIPTVQRLFDRMGGARGDGSPSEIVCISCTDKASIPARQRGIEAISGLQAFPGRSLASTLNGRQPRMPTARRAFQLKLIAADGAIRAGFGHRSDREHRPGAGNSSSSAAANRRVKVPRAARKAWERQRRVGNRSPGRCQADWGDPTKTWWVWLLRSQSVALQASNNLRGSLRNRQPIGNRIKGRNLAGHESFNKDSSRRLDPFHTASRPPAFVAR